MMRNISDIIERHLKIYCMKVRKEWSKFSGMIWLTNFGACRRRSIM